MFVGHSEKEKKIMYLIFTVMMSILFFGAGLTTCTNNLDALLASRTLVWYWALDKCASAGWQWARAAVLFWHWCNCVEMAVCPTSCYLFNANGNITPLAISSQLPPCYLPNWHRFLFSTQGSSLFACMIAKEVLFWETDWSRKEKKKDTEHCCMTKWCRLLFIYL